jgi:hypothetical protein
MDIIPNDVIRHIALFLSPRDVLSLCLSAKKFNGNIGKCAFFWRNKIKVDFPRQTYSINFYQKNPKQLYRKLCMKSKIVYLLEREFPELKAFNDTFDIDDIDEEITMANEITKCITEDFIERVELKRGDVLRLGWTGGFRNDDKYMWDGEKAVILDYEYIDYGSVSEDFSFPEFPPHYFSESIDYSNIVRLSPEKVKEVIDNFSADSQTSFITDKYNKYTVKISIDDLYLDMKIKFNKIFLKNNYLTFNDNNELVLDVYFQTINRGGSSGIYTCETQFTYKWKEAIISIEPNSPSTKYSWDNNILSVVSKRN